jgi:protein O-mannosyl-transferase
MSLNSKQKKYIQKNISKQPLIVIADNLSLPQNEILMYLKKIWRKEKYDAYVDTFRESFPEKFENVENIFEKLLANRKTVLIILCLLVFLLYSWTLGFDFVSDDKRIILNNQALLSYKIVFNESLYSIGYLFNWVVAGLFGLETPWPYRLVNILCHLGSVLSIFFIFEIIYKKRTLSFFTAALFAVHPLLIESVTWIAGSSSSHYTFLFLISFLFYLKSYINKKYYIFSIILFFLASFFSHKAPIIFLLIILYEYIYGDIRKNFKKLMPYLLIGLFSLATAIFSIEGRVDSLKSEYSQQASANVNPLLQIVLSLTQYIYLAIFPLVLSIYQTELKMGVLSFIIRSAILFVAFVYLFYSLLKVKGSYKKVILFWKSGEFSKNRLSFQSFYIFWLLFYIISLIPSLSPFGISWIVAERYAYLGIIGIFALFGYFLYKLTLIDKFKSSIYVIFIALLLLLGSRSVIRNLDWRNEDTLWIATGKTSPSAHNIHNNLGDVYARQGDMDKAVYEFKKAIEINPLYSDAYHNLANTYVQIAKSNLNKGDTEQYSNNIDLAILNYTNAIKYNPNIWQSYQDLGSLYYSLDKKETSLEYFKKALSINPNDMNLLVNTGIVYMGIGDKESAREYFRSALDKDPGNQNVINAIAETYK